MQLKFDIKFFLHLSVKSVGGLAWDITAVYASPNPNIRRYLREKLNGIEVNRSLALIGGFNCTLLDEERSFGTGVSTCFQSWVGDRGLIDLGCVGSWFTWSYGQSMETRRAARLDKGLCCVEWRSMFPAATFRRLSHSYSDHCPFYLS